ncbi:MAG: expansin EXLX1 family cellulose-binding protein [Chloroflexota bacterium]
MTQTFKRISILGALLLLFTILTVWSQIRTAFSQSDQFVWLPLIVNPEGQSINTNPVNQGIATYYNATGAGNCSYDASPNNLMVAAMNAEEYDNSNVCGSFVEVTGALGTVVVRIVDQCPECAAGHLDLSREAFAEIDEIIKGRVPITWQIVSPDIDGPIVYQFKDGSNQWWTAVQIRNHRNPIAKFEYLNDSNQWVEVGRTSYNYFVQSSPGMGVGPYTFRVTDTYGNVLVDSGIQFIENGEVSGADQFPAGP